VLTVINYIIVIDHTTGCPPCYFDWFRLNDRALIPSRGKMPSFITMSIFVRVPI